MSLEGQQIGRYRIMRLLGSGGMGEVYLAEDARIEQQVAIKVIRAEVSPYPDAQATQEAARLFQREAKAIAKLDHPHILPLYDYGEERLGNLTVIYLVMPYRPEGSLSDWLRGRGQAGLLSPPEVAHIMRQAASALQHAHTRQIIHQDVKPANFLMHSNEEDTQSPDVLLADFGVARFTSATSSMSHTIRGTPTYMAPEQWSGEPVPATDQYALAIMTYELLAGRPPFQGPPMRLMHLHAMTPPPPPSTFNPPLSAELDAVLLHALAKEPEQRFASMTAFATAFQQAVQRLQEADAPTSLSATPPSVSQSDIRAVLAISTAEAQTGTTRTLTLPGGRRVSVPLPAGIRDGQIVRLDGQGEAFPAGGPAGALILSIQVKAAEDLPSLSTASAAAAEATVLTAKPETPAAGMQTVSTTGQQPTVSSTARPEVVTPPSLSVSPTEAATRSMPSPQPAQMTWSNDLSGPTEATIADIPSLQPAPPKEKNAPRETRQPAQMPAPPLLTSKPKEITSTSLSPSLPAQTKQPERQSQVHKPSPTVQKTKGQTPSQGKEGIASPPNTNASAPATLPRSSQRRSRAGWVIFWVAFSLLVGGAVWWVFSPSFPFKSTTGYGTPPSEVAFFILMGIFFDACGILCAAQATRQAQYLSWLRHNGVTVTGHISAHRIKSVDRQMDYAVDIAFSRFFSYFVTYQYECTGKTYEREQALSLSHYQQLDVGTSVMVSYLPDKPSTSTLVEQKDYRYVRWVVGAVVFLILSIFGWGGISSLH